MSRYIAVDLDGTLVMSGAPSDGAWRMDAIGEPIAPMIKRVRRWLEQGIEVRIFTARVSPVHGAGVGEAREAIDRFCRSTFGRSLRVTCEKDMDMIECWDDRSVQVEENTGRQLGPSRIDGEPPQPNALAFIDLFSRTHPGDDINEV